MNDITRNHLDVTGSPGTVRAARRRLLTCPLLHDLHSVLRETSLELDFLTPWHPPGSLYADLEQLGLQVDAVFLTLEENRTAHGQARVIAAGHHRQGHTRLADDRQLQAATGHGTPDMFISEILRRLRPDQHTAPDQTPPAAALLDSRNGPARSTE